jgi:hypothetical protein
MNFCKGGVYSVVRARSGAVRGLGRTSKAKNRLLLECEEKELVTWILSMERRGFPPFLIDVKRMAQTLLVRRDPDGVPRIVGKNWTGRFLNDHPDIKPRLSRRRDRQRVKQENPHVIRP